MTRATKTLVGVFIRAWGGGKATLLTVMVALTLATVTPAFGANGSAFILGSLNNTATAITRLVGNVNGPALYILNPNTGAAATGALFQVASGHPPFKVTSTTKVPNLNADLVDGETFSCPSGMLLHEGVCIETTKRSATSWDTADSNCLNSRRRLPTVAELQTFRGRVGQDLASGEWTSARGITNGVLYAETVDSNGASTLSQNGSQIPYRCVAATRP
jgi:hypothetical protein